MQLDAAQAKGRMIAAGRMLAGLDQTDLAAASGVSASTISNVERGRIEARSATLKAIRKALRENGVTLTNDPTNFHISVGTTYEPTEDD